jgi:hypothetical protein
MLCFQLSNMHSKGRALCSLRPPGLLSNGPSTVKAADTSTGMVGSNTHGCCTASLLLMPANGCIWCFVCCFVAHEHVRHNKSDIAHRGRTRINH